MESNKKQTFTSFCDAKIRSNFFFFSSFTLHFTPVFIWLCVSKLCRHHSMNLFRTLATYHVANESNQPKKKTTHIFRIRKSLLCRKTAIFIKFIESSVWENRFHTHSKWMNHFTITHLFYSQLLLMIFRVRRRQPMTMTTTCQRHQSNYTWFNYCFFTSVSEQKIVDNFIAF